MPRWETVSIIGIGLIGGSIGRALRQRGLAGRVRGVARRPATLDEARRVGAVDETDDHLERAVADADLVLVCTPVDVVAEHVRRSAAAAPEGVLITDAASTKERLAAELKKLPRGARFVGSHPLAGSERTGPAHSSPDLFVDRTTVITPVEATEESVVEVRELWEALGSRVVQLDPAEHDRLLASSSHLPHLLATALAAATPAEALAFTAGGWADTTRVAAGDPALWAAILRDNRSHSLSALDSFEKVLAAVRDALERDDLPQLLSWLEAGKRNRDAVGN